MAAAGLGFLIWAPITPDLLVIPGLITLLVATILGAPVFVTISGATLILSKD